MSDITICNNNECELKVNCYRYRAIPSDFMQSYSNFNSENNKDCEYYEPLKEGDRIVTIDKLK